MPNLPLFVARRGMNFSKVMKVSSPLIYVPQNTKVAHLCKLAPGSRFKLSQTEATEFVIPIAKVVAPSLRCLAATPATVISLDTVCSCFYWHVDPDDTLTMTVRISDYLRNISPTPSPNSALRSVLKKEREPYLMFFNDREMKTWRWLLICWECHQIIALPLLKILPV